MAAVRAAMEQLSPRKGDAAAVGPSGAEAPDGSPGLAGGAAGAAGGPSSAAPGSAKVSPQSGTALHLSHAREREVSSRASGSAACRFSALYALHEPGCCRKHGCQTLQNGKMVAGCTQRAAAGAQRGSRRHLLGQPAAGVSCSGSLLRPVSQTLMRKWFRTAWFYGCSADSELNSVCASFHRRLCCGRGATQGRTKWRSGSSWMVPAALCSPSRCFFTSNHVAPALAATGAAHRASCGNTGSCVYVMQRPSLA